MVSTVITVDPDPRVRDIADLLPDRISSVPVVGTDGILELCERSGLMNVTRRKRLVENPGKHLHIDVGHPGAAVHRGRPAEASRHLWQKRCLLECSAHAQLLNPWQCFVLVERRRGGQRPFERRCAYAPRVGSRLILLGESISNADEKHDQADPRDVRPDR